MIDPVTLGLAASYILTALFFAGVGYAAHQEYGGDPDGDTE